VNETRDSPSFENIPTHIPPTRPNTLIQEVLSTELSEEWRQAYLHDHPIPRCPLHIARWVEELKEYPDKLFVTSLLMAIRNGVRLGYHGPRLRQDCKNLISAIEHPEVIDADIASVAHSLRHLSPSSAVPL
jgi:hypothetical protein